MARYRQKFMNRAVARLLPPESTALEVIAGEVGIGAGILQRWREKALACATAGIAPRTLQRWKAVAGWVSGDSRPLTARATPTSTRLAPNKACFQEIGRSRGGLTTELHVAVDALAPPARDSVGRAATLSSRRSPVESINAPSIATSTRTAA